MNHQLPGKENPFGLSCHIGKTIEKNVCQNIIDTLLDTDGKSKDNLNARFDI